LRKSSLAALSAALVVLFAGGVPTAVQNGVGEPQRTVVALMPNGDVVAEVEKPEGRVTRAPLLATTPDEPSRPRQDGPPKKKPQALEDEALNPPEQLAETLDPNERDDAFVPQADATGVVARQTTIAPPPGNSSSVAEPSVGTQGDGIFMTHNWYAEISTDNGATFNYISPYTMFPTAGAFSGGFCCDQRVAQDPTRNLIFWQLQYNKTGSTSTSTNGYRIAVAHGAGSLATNTWQFHDFTPADFGLTGMWLDFPHLQVSSNYLYFTANAFTTTSNSFHRAVIGRIPLAALDANTPFTMDTYVTTLFSLAPVTGATDTMYFGTRVSSNSISVLAWPESSPTPTVIPVTGLSSTSSSGFTCTTPDNLNPCGRADTRMQTGWVTPAEVGFMWSAGADASHPYPYTRVVILNPASPATVISQPDIFSTTAAMLYPAVAVNARGHLGGTIDRLGGSGFTSLRAIIRDDFSPEVTTSGWETFAVAEGNSGTSSRWGDYNGVVPHEKYPNTWVAVGHVQLGTSGNSGSSIRNYWFMRERDVPGASQVVTLSFAPASVAVAENAGIHAASVVLTTSNGLPTVSTVSVNYSTATATAGNSDYSLATGVLTWPAGTASGDGSRTINVSIANDTSDEPNESFSIALSNPSGAVLANALQAVTITDDDVALISIDDVSISEGNSGTKTATFIARLSSAAAQTVTVNYATASGTATPSASLGGPFSGGSVSIPSSTADVTPYPSTASVSAMPGTISKVTVTLTGLSHTWARDLDVLLVGPAGQKIVLVSDAGGAQAATNVTLTFDDGAATSLTTGTMTTGLFRPTNLSDNDPAGPDTFASPAPAAPYATTLSTFNGSNPNGTWSLYVVDDYSLADGGSLTSWSLQIETGVPSGDYASTSGVVSFSPGTLTRSITTTLVGDTSPEGSETFFLNLSAPTNATLADSQAQATILNDDTSISIADVAQNEGGTGVTNFTFTVSLSHPLGVSANVNYATSPGTATAGGDYTHTAGSLVFAAGTTTGSLVVPVMTDNLGEENETFTVTLSGATAGTITDANAIGMITNDDNATVYVNDASIAEGNSGTKTLAFTVRLVPSSAGVVSMQYATANGTALAATDYEAATGTLTFAPSTTTQSVSITISGDTQVEPDETFFVNVSNVTGAMSGDAQGLGTITNDEAVAAPSGGSSGGGGGGGSSGGGGGSAPAPAPSPEPPSAPPPTPLAPGVPAALTVGVSNRTVSLSWSPATSGEPATSYIVEVGTAPGAANALVFPTGSAATALVASNVSNGTYYIRVRAVTALGTSAPSNEAVAVVTGTSWPTPGPAPTPTAAPGAPQNFHATANGTTVTMTWSAPATGGAPLFYVIEAGSAPGLANLVSFSTGNPSLSFVAAAPPGTYFLRVRAGNAAGTSTASNDVVLVVNP
jgi:subtilisin-like proprotein convertase family protein